MRFLIIETGFISRLNHKKIIMIQYEWTLETIDEYGDIIDSDFCEILNFDKLDLEDKDLGLVMDEFSQQADISNRLWAYVKDGKLPQYFEDAMQHTTPYKVPQRFHNELKKYLKSELKKYLKR